MVFNFTDIFLSFFFPALVTATRCCEQHLTALPRVVFVDGQILPGTFTDVCAFISQQVIDRKGTDRTHAKQTKNLAN